jgi:hypothetical protein
MLYNLCLLADHRVLVPVMTAMMLLVIITFIKEKRDERKRA